MRKLTARIVAAVLTVSMLGGCSASNTSQGEKAAGAAGGATEAAQEKNEDTKASGEAITLRYSHTVAEQEGHPWTVATNTFKETLEELSGGTIMVENYPGGQLGGDTDLLDSVQLGTLDIGMISSGTIANVTNCLAGIDMPFIFDGDYEYYHEVLSGEIGQHLLDRLAEDVEAVVPLGYAYQAWRHLWSENGIYEISDMKGLKTRCMQSPIHIDIFQALGATPTALPYNDIYSNMQTGTIDGFEMDAAGAINSNFFEVCKHMTYSAHFTNTPVILFSRKVWDTMSEEQRGWIKAAAYEACEASYIAAVSTEESYIEQLKAEGVEVIEVDLTPFQAAVADMIQKYCDSNGDVDYLVSEMQKIER